MNCPDENTLLRVALGTSDDAELAAIEAHLDGCDACRRVLAAAASGPVAPRARPLQPGDALGRYVLESVQGVGAMGVVYAAQDPVLGRRVALKVLREESARLLPEAQTMARLRHDHVVQVTDFGEHDGVPFLVMELVEGATLGEWLRTKPSRPQVLEAFLGAGRGLAAAHAAGVVHRDFKPSNVLMGAGRARVTDFGLATDAPAAGALVGTLAYMAPEQLARQPATPRSDQFAWCVALAEALTGQRPFGGPDAASLTRAMQQPPQLAGVPRGLRAALARGLAIDPSQRFESMDSLLQAITRRRQWMPWVAASGVLATITMVLASGPRTHAPNAVVPLHLRVGAAERLDCPGIQRVALDDPKVLGVKVEGDVLRVTGLAAGHATLNVWEKDRGRRPFDVTVE